MTPLRPSRFRIITYFIQRDFQIRARFLKGWALEIFLALGELALLYFFNRWLVSSGSTMKNNYGISYFWFVISGLITNQLCSAAHNGVLQNIRMERASGTLEFIFIGRCSYSSFLIGSLLGPWLMALIKVSLLAIAALFLLSASIQWSQIPWVMFGFLCMTLVFASVGAIVAGISLRSGWGEGFEQLFLTLSWFLGGVYFPISVFPAPLRQFCATLPLTQGLDFIRMSWFVPVDPHILLSRALILLLWTIFFTAGARWIFGVMIQRCREEGAFNFF